MTLFERYEALNSRRQFLVGLLAAFVLLFLSTPRNLLFGYIEAEDGSTYLRYARSATLLRAMFAPHQGYYALVPNLTMLLAGRLFPLVTAAWIDEWVSIGFRLCTVWFIYSCESIRTPRGRLLTSILLAILPATVMFPGCLNTQYFLAVITAILLISDPDRHRVLRFVFLLIGGLTSPTSCILLPFFLLRAWRRKSLSAYIQAATLSLCTCVQFGIVIWSSSYSTRTVQAAPLSAYIDTFTNHTLILPFLTRIPYRLLSAYLERHSGTPWILVAFCGVTLFCGFARLIWTAGSAATRMMLVGVWAVTIAIVTTGTATLLSNVERYYIGVNSCFAIALVLAMEQFQLSRRIRALRISTALLVMVGVSGIVDAVRFFKLQQEPLHWTQQIADWNNDPGHEFKTGPWFWWYPFYLPKQPLSLKLPPYVYDTSTRESVLKQLPQVWFKPMDESTQPTSLNFRIDTSKK